MIIILNFSSIEWTVSFCQAGGYRWPAHLTCRFNNLSFKSGIHKKVDFAATEQQRLDTKTVYFGFCSAVDFVDIEILKRFPNLNGLRFRSSNIPILRNIFTVELKMIQYLDLNSNKIQNLEPHVFDELVELKWISLSGNEIEEILHPIFAKNKKLEFADLSCNKIRSLHPNIFEYLPRLDKVWFSENPIINKIFDQSNIKTMNEELKPLFDNYARKCGNSNRIRELELVSFLTQN
jgi:hypothetical protein